MAYDTASSMPWPPGILMDPPYAELRDTAGLQDGGYALPRPSGRRLGAPAGRRTVGQEAPRLVRYPGPVEAVLGVERLARPRFPEVADPVAADHDAGLGEGLGDRAAEAADHAVILDGEDRPRSPAPFGEEIRVDRLERVDVQHRHLDTAAGELARGVERVPDDRSRRCDRKVAALAQ